MGTRTNPAVSRLWNRTTVGRISVTDRGDLVVAVPAPLVRVLALLALLLGVAVTVVGFAAILPVLTAWPLALMTVSLAVATVLVSPFALIVLVAILLR